MSLERRNTVLLNLRGVSPGSLDPVAPVLVRSWRGMHGSGKQLISGPPESKWNKTRVSHSAYSMTNELKCSNRPPSLRVLHLPSVFGIIHISTFMLYVCKVTSLVDRRHSLVLSSISLRSCHNT